MKKYSKLVAAVVGVVAVILGPSALGITEVELDTELITQAVLGVATAFGVFQSVNAE